jgi:hypothetical protein
MHSHQQTDRANQRSRLLELLKSHSPYWVPISEVVSIARFQYGARILELRRLGHRIENDPGRAFRLATKPAPVASPSTTADVETHPLFPNAPPRHLDLG